MKFFKIGKSKVASTILPIHKSFANLATKFPSLQNAQSKVGQTVLHSQCQFITRNYDDEYKTQYSSRQPILNHQNDILKISKH